MAIATNPTYLLRMSTVTGSTSDTALSVGTSFISSTSINFAGSGFTTAHFIYLSKVSTEMHRVKSITGAASSVINVFGTFSATGSTSDTNVITRLSYGIISDVRDFTGPGGAAAIINVSDFDSTAVEKLPGLRDEGQLSMTLNYNATNSVQQALRTDRAARQRNRFVIRFTEFEPGSSSYPSWCSFDGYCMSFNVSAAVDNQLMLNAVLEIDGPVNYQQADLGS